MHRSSHFQTNCPYQPLTFCEPCERAFCLHEPLTTYASFQNSSFGTCVSAAGESPPRPPSTVAIYLISFPRRWGFKLRRNGGKPHLPFTTRNSTLPARPASKFHRVELQLYKKFGKVRIRLSQMLSVATRAHNNTIYGASLSFWLNKFQGAAGVDEYMLMESGQDLRRKIYQTKRHCIS